MIPFLDVEKINHKSAIKSDISSIQEEKSDFAEIFNLLSNQTSKKESNIKAEKKDWRPFRRSPSKSSPEVPPRRSGCWKSVSPSDIPGRNAATDSADA